MACLLDFLPIDALADAQHRASEFQLAILGELACHFYFDATLWVIDLGVAKVTRDIDSLKTMEKAVFGTPAYMSPEQATDSSAVDVRSDIYSLGIVFFEMLCGHSPYRGGTTERIVQELLSAQPIQDVRMFNHNVSPKISAVLLLMCEKKVDERIKSPAELLLTFSRLGYKVPAPMAAGQQFSQGADQPYSYDVETDTANHTLSFKTDDREILKFVDGLKHRRLRKRILWALLAAGVALGVVGLVVYRFMR